MGSGRRGICLVNISAITDGLLLLAPVSGAAVSQFFGARPAVYRRFGLAGHEGVDYACAVGTLVMAAAGGVVWRAGDSAGPWGTRVIVRHEFGYTVYAHLSSVQVAPGQAVAAGQVLGLSGATGNVTGPHLHFGLALPEARPGFACPAVMGATWWHDPLLVGDAVMAVRGGAAICCANALTRAVGDDARGMRCTAHGFQQGGDVW